MWSTLRSGVAEFVSTVKDDTVSTVKEVLTTDNDGAGGETAKERAVRELRADERTYTVPPSASEAAAYAAFAGRFDLGARADEIGRLLRDDARIAQFHASATAEDDGDGGDGGCTTEQFWTRYFFRLDRVTRRCALDAQAVAAAAAATSASADDEDDLTWDVDDDGGAVAPPRRAPAPPAAAPSPPPPAAAPAAAPPVAAPSPAGGVAASADHERRQRALEAVARLTHDVARLESEKRAAADAHARELAELRTQNEELRALVRSHAAALPAAPTPAPSLSAAAVAAPDSDDDARPPQPPPAAAAPTDKSSWSGSSAQVEKSSSDDAGAEEDGWDDWS